LLYGIDVHIFFPSTMYTPGYEEENKFKPKITLKIEEADDGLTPDLAALRLFKGKHSHCLSMALSGLLGHLKRFPFSFATHLSNSAKKRA